ncbi:ATP/GTP-binding protein [Lipingzhangella sp. LS1_29]|uniref:ATP/GTP-binding protein n=1 Tax=Lipingzhangella rawalii TaxID=2055835 RepID=A0ABU2H7R4_9ACTN|nr:ATP/GTP-binding protein [Lipingzhangella rawalii]MDS1271348.1 ATP/GTP-binding protein [Lipingzhangella rawalii]
MASNGSEPPARATLPSSTKILIAGGFGVGKTTMVRSVSDIAPLRTEELLTVASGDVDDLTGVAAKNTTTVALDFGKISLGDQLMLYLFGTPGQDRFWFMWDDLAHGALGVVVLADTRRLADCFAAVDFVEQRGFPFVLAVNLFDEAERYTTSEVRDALALSPEIPIVLCDARERDSGIVVLRTLLEHALQRLSAPSGPPAVATDGATRCP